MNGYAVQDAWVRHAVAQQARGGQALRDSLERSEKARRWVERNLPDLRQNDGQPCTFAVAAAIDVLRMVERGELAMPAGDVKARSRAFGAAVRARRTERFGRLLEHQPEQLTFDHVALREVRRP